MELFYLNSAPDADHSKQGRFRCARLSAAVVFLIGIVLLTLWFVMGQPESFSTFWDKFREDFGLTEGQQQGENIWTDGGEHSDRNADPFVGDNTTTAWSPEIIISTDGYESSGQVKLRLEIFNALDDGWQEDFQLAVSDWREGAADLNLDLVITRVEADPSCIPIEGVIKVCNNNFGPTDWVGINDARVFYETNQGSRGGPGYIISSVAKMNDYYLLQTSQVGRQHAMCHELGHSLGLPHTDENPLNKDLGNCMDYTNTPENNIHPGEVNFQRLALIYKDFLIVEESSRNQQQGNKNDKPQKLRTLR